MPGRVGYVSENAIKFKGVLYTQQQNPDRQIDVSVQCVLCAGSIPARASKHGAVV